MIMRNQDIWSAIDAAAEQAGISTSALARRAGLDPTSLNPSKRSMADGRPRWPSTESIAKILESAEMTFAEFAALVAGKPAKQERPNRHVPVIGFAEAGQAGYFDDGGYPTGAGWDEVLVPQPYRPGKDDPHAYALTISGDSMEPVYRKGDIVVVSPAAVVRPGDRVIARTIKGEVMAKLLTQRTSRRIELSSLNPNFEPRQFTVAEISALHRIIWASQ
jgi:phage repressor protein C with HTH and peptisase S24 domain